MKIELGINYDEEMICIRIDGITKAYGNFWDVMPPSKVKEFFKLLGLEYSTFKLPNIG